MMAVSNGDAPMDGAGSSSDVVVVPGRFDVNVLYRELRDIRPPDLSWDLSLRRPKTRFRDVDPAMLVAIVGAAGSSLTALVAGVLQVISAKGGQRITIETSSGARIDIPAALPPDERQALLDAITERPSKIWLPKE
jgi:hypothetical protein